MTSTDNKIPVIVAGALGKMGSEVVKAVCGSNDCLLIGAIDACQDKEGEDIGELIGLGSTSVHLSSDLEGTLCLASQQYRDSIPSNNPVLVDFTQPSVVYKHTRTAIAYGVNPVIGTTGLSRDQINDLSEFAKKASVGTAVIPNFSVGMVLLQQAAAAASYYYENIELIECHHNQKRDSPSGTCLKTAELIEESGKVFNKSDIEEEESIKGSRGGLSHNGINIHSIRLPGIVANQQVIFGSKGETYQLIHNTIERSAYMPGVLLTVGKIRNHTNLIYGLEKLL